LLENLLTGNNISSETEETSKEFPDVKEFKTESVCIRRRQRDSLIQTVSVLKGTSLNPSGKMVKFGRAVFDEKMFEII